MPFTVPFLRIDMSSSTSSKSGISWLEWNHDGTLLGLCNGESSIFLVSFALYQLTTSIREPPYRSLYLRLSIAITRK